MTRAELLEIIRNGENSGVEFKRDTIEGHVLARELVALANLEGGTVLLGVEDDGSISGITQPKLEEWVMSICRDKIRPGLIPFYERIKDVELGKDVTVIQVSRGYTVHTLWHHNKNAYFIRVGSQTREPTPQELERLFQQRGDLRLELRPISAATMADLDMRRLRNYFTYIRNQEVPDEHDEQGWKNLLFNTEMIVEGGITIAAILLFGRTPHRFLPQAGIDAFAFSGKEKDYTARERAYFSGPMTPLLTSVGEPFEPGLLEQTFAFVQRNIGVTGGLEPGGLRRLQERFDYPGEAVREAIINALIHRDYLLSGTNIELSIYEDRMEIISPGRLPNGITPTRMLTGCRATRNQLIKDVMRDYRYLEHSGMGVPRKIVKYMKEHNGTDPEFSEEGEFFTVRLLKGKPQ
ncbi:MAG: ATP-dependent helicase RecG domain protein [Gammaproteobacteria bacterium]|jgi:ATP-dependent DNA helicase RecG|nr:ATP-dependent helicase RecG domain protein [Gammaproteobacteria bacterium]